MHCHCHSFIVIIFEFELYFEKHKICKKKKKKSISYCVITDHFALGPLTFPAKRLDIIPLLATRQSANVVFPVGNTHLQTQSLKLQQIFYVRRLTINKNKDHTSHSP